MTTSVHSIQSAQAQTQTDQSIQPPKNLQQQQTAQQNTAVQDQVTISEEAKQALANQTK